MRDSKSRLEEQVAQAEFPLLSGVVSRTPTTDEKLQQRTAENSPPLTGSAARGRTAGPPTTPRAVSELSPASSNFKNRRRLLTKDNLGDGDLKIRPFEKEDSDGVQKICFDHFRSSCLAAVRYYIAAHFQDLAFLTFLGFCFLSLKKLLIIVLLFNSYLFLKSRYEMEQYIRRDCTDLRDVMNTYMNSDQTCRFWVAEIVRNSTEKLAGCVGLVPSRENPQIAKLVRLMVERRHRRMRIGSRLLLQLENYARENGYYSVRIYTNTLNPSHMKFVRQHGYTIVQTIRRGLMRGDLVTWHKPLVLSANGGDPGVPTRISQDEDSPAGLFFSEKPLSIDGTMLNGSAFSGQKPQRSTSERRQSTTSREKEDLVNLRIRSAAQHVMD